MKKTITNLTLVFIFMLFSCKNENQRFITSKTVANYDSIKRVKIDRGILIMENFNFTGDYVVYSYCPLIYTDTFPSWITDKRKPEFSISEYKFKPKISDIEVPYVLFKNRNEDYFYIIKNKDTLKFRIETNDEN